MDLLRSFVIELISTFNNSNQKIRTGAQESFLNMAKILSEFKALPQMFQMLLVGLAAETPQT